MSNHEVAAALVARAGEWHGAAYADEINAAIQALRATRSHHPYDVAGHLPGGDAHSDVDQVLLDAADAVEQLANVTLPFYAAPLRALVDHARATAEQRPMESAAEVLARIGPSKGPGWKRGGS